MTQVKGKKSVVPEDGGDIKDFQQRLDAQKAEALFKLMLKYRPENTQAKNKKKKSRKSKDEQAKSKKKDAQAKTPKKEEAKSPKKDAQAKTIEMGLNSVALLVKEKKARLVVIAADVEPIKLVLHLPALCRKMNVPYCIVDSKAQLTPVVKMKTTCVAIADVQAQDRKYFQKLLKAIKTDDNEELPKLAELPKAEKPAAKPTKTDDSADTPQAKTRAAKAIKTEDSSPQKRKAVETSDNKTPKKTPKKTFEKSDKKTPNKPKTPKKKAVA